MSYLCYLCFFNKVVSNTYCVVFLLCFSSTSVYPYMLPVSFLIAPSIFSNVYLYEINR